MPSPPLFLLLLLFSPALSSLSPSIRQSSGCGSFCAFSLCNFASSGDPIFLPNPPAPSTVLTTPRVAGFPYICLNGTNIGQILAHRPIRIKQNNKFIPLSSWRPKSLSAPFPTNLIRPEQIPFTQWSGVGRTVADARDFTLLHDKCFLLPIRKYQVVNKKQGHAVPRQVPKNMQRTACVAFRAVAPVILAEIVWDSGDIFDILVTEPDGDTVFFSNTETEAGVYTEDLADCESGFRFGRENIVYRPGKKIERGTYTLNVRHFRSCDNKLAKWAVTVMVNGEIRFRDNGVSSIGSNEVISTGRFDVLDV